MIKYLKIIKNFNIFPNSKIKKPKKYIERQTVRAIALNKKGEIALVTNPIHNLYSFPGGGAESDNLENEIIRECAEEISQEVVVVKKIGKIKEYRDRESKKYITTCFEVKAIKKIKKDFRTESEIKNGLNVVWFNVDEAKKIFEKQVKKIEEGKINFYNTAFNIVRDLEFLNEYLNINENNTQK